ncbi:MAG: alpha-ketoglutarate-dependent dioxygenase AlkB [Hyphomicrobiales bacterium]
MGADKRRGTVEGLSILRGYFARPAREALLTAIQGVMRKSPPFRPVMPRSGRPFSVMMTNCGPLGWVSDRAGYRYQTAHPETGAPWPPMPDSLLSLWRDVAGYPAPPQACLVNIYSQTSRMGLHRDMDEETFSAPVISVSLGDTATFRIATGRGKAPTRSFPLASGDVLIMGGAARLAYHGIDRIHDGSSTLIAQGGRINLTLRRVTPALRSEG